MNRSLIAQLKKMDDVGFFELQLIMQTVSNIRAVQKKFEKRDDEMAVMMGITVNNYKYLKKCAFEIDLRLIAKFEAGWRKWEIEKAEASKIEVVAFPDYKYSKPIHELINEDLQRELEKAKARIAELERKNHE